MSDSSLDAADSLKDIDRILKSDYRFGLFDFAYFLAITVTNIFLANRSSSDSKTDLWKYDKAAERYRNVLLRRQEITKRLDQELQHERSNIRDNISRSARLKNKTKLILLWSYALNKLRWKSVRILNTSGELETPAIGIETKTLISWNSYQFLISWFYERLSSCSYSCLFRPAPFKNKEKEAAISLREKNSKLFRLEVASEIWLYCEGQRYFLKNEFVIRRNRPEQSVRRPVIYIKFGNKTIELGEMSSGKIIVYKYSFSKGKFTRTKKRISAEFIIPAYPLIEFPSGEKYYSEKYMPPPYPSYERMNIMWDDFMNGVISSSDRSEK